MFSSFLGGSKDSNAASASGGEAGSSTSNELHPPHERLASPESTFGPLTKQDLEWHCSGAFAAETQTFYALTGGKDAKLIMCQVIHSGVGMWYPQINFNFRLYDPATGKREWRSANVSGFTTPAPAKGGINYDKRSVKSDQFTILVDPAHPDTYTIEGKYDADTDVSLKFKRMEGAPGFKLGSGPKGGMTYFGAEKASSNGPKDGTPDYAAASDGYVVHRFWPRCVVSGIVRVGSEVYSLDSSDSRGIFVHAIQGMRANLVAANWNFGYFNSTDEKEGVSLMMMEFTTTSSYGRKTVNIGSVIVEDQLVAVVANGSATHLENEQEDTDTSYPAPGKIRWNWASSRSLLPSTSEGENNTVSAEILLDLQAEGSTPAPAGSAPAQRQFRGLIEKVDFLAHIPFVVKKVISYVAGTKPFIYQFLNNTTATIQVPSSDGKEMRKLVVDGTMFNEATFISA